MNTIVHGGSHMESGGACIAHVLPWRAIGGTELATLRVAQAAAVSGYRSVMVCRADAPLVREFFASRGFSVVVFESSLLENGMLSNIRESRRVMRELRRRSVEIVHCADVYGGDLLALAARIAGFRVVCHVRNRYDWLTRKQRVWLRFASRLVFVSKDTANRFGKTARGTAGLVARRRVVLYDGLATDDLGIQFDPNVTRAKLGIRQDALVIGMVARISVQKDHLTLVRAAERVCQRHPRACFLIVGDDGSQGGAEPENAQRVMSAIAASPFSNRFVCTGHRDDVPDLMATFDVFVLCTHREGLPLVILEAMAQGKPVVATAVDGIPEIVEDGVTGYLHPHEDAVALADRINKLLDDPAQTAAMGRRSRDVVDRSFSQHAFVENVGALYSGLDASLPASHPSHRNAN